MPLTTYATFDPSPVISGSDTVFRFMIASSVQVFGPARSHALPSSGAIIGNTQRREIRIAEHCTDSRPGNPISTSRDPRSQRGSGQASRMRRFRPELWTKHTNRFDIPGGCTNMLLLQCDVDC